MKSHLILWDAVRVFCGSNGLFVVPIRARRMGVNANVFVSPYLLPKHYLPDIFTYSPNIRTSPLKGSVVQEHFRWPKFVRKRGDSERAFPIFASASLSFPSPVCLS